MLSLASVLTNVNE